MEASPMFPMLTPHKPGIRSILLGLFVLFQLLYLPLSNVIQLVPRDLPQQHGELDSAVQREGTATSCRPIPVAVNGVGLAIDRWGELSGQAQRWSLFAPDVARQSCFPVITCYCVDRLNYATVTLGPDTASETDHYFRWPSPLCRLFAYESLLAVVYRNCSEVSLSQRQEEWGAAISERVRQQQNSLQAYFRWNLELFKKRYPDQPAPVEMVLHVLVMPSPKPGETVRPASFEVPLARWFPKRSPNQEFLAVEAYDPTLKDFVRLRIEASP
jgi:hypothetical protein